MVRMVPSPSERMHLGANRQCQNIFRPMPESAGADFRAVTRPLGLGTFGPAVAPAAQAKMVLLLVAYKVGRCGRGSIDNP